MKRRRWDREELIIAFALYCQTSFGKTHWRNPLIIEIAGYIDRTPSALAMKMLNFASLDPEIVDSGRKGLGNASLKDKDAWNEFHGDWESAISEAQKILGDTLYGGSTDEEDYSSEDAKYEVSVRKDQSFFRNAVLSSYQDTCCMSGVNCSELLVASHIVPWREDRKNRLNPRNGLCLSVLYDKVFDLGLITISKKYRVKVSEELKAIATDSFSKRNLHSVHGEKIMMPEKFLPSRRFLEFHNEKIFRG